MKHFDIWKCVSDCICNPAVKWVVLDRADLGRCPKRNWDLALGNLRRECVVNLLDNLDVVHLSLPIAVRPGLPVAHSLLAAIDNIQRRVDDLDPRYNYRVEGFHAKKIRAYAEYALMEEWEPIPIPDGVSDEAAALCEPASVAVHAVRMSQLKLGDPVAVIGAGPIGLFTVQAARAAGADSILVSEPSAQRRSAAAKLGADVVIDPTQDDPVAAAEAMTGSMGVCVAFDCAGVKGTLDQSASMVRPRGQAVLIAVPWEPLPLEAADWMARHINVQTTFGQDPGDWHTTLNLMQRGSIDVRPMLQESDFIRLEDIQSAFESLFTPSDQLQMIVKL